MSGSETKTVSRDELLDNPAWYALRGRLAGFAESDPKGLAVRFQPDVNIFCALGECDADGWNALAELAGPGGFAVLFRARVPAPPPGWDEAFRDFGWQMVAGDIPGPPESHEVTRLGRDDVDEMLALTRLTEPGPFLPRTIELGSYLGIKQDGRLVAMAGQRLRVPGFTEVSAVCTHPDARGQGLASALTLAVASEIRASGDEAFLHVANGNDGALRLYESLGFTVRKKVDAVALTRKDE